MRVIQRNSLYLAWGLLFCLLPGKVHGQKIETVEFSEVCNFGEGTLSITAKSKAQRISSRRAGIVEITYMDHNMPDSLKTAIAIAASTWEACMNIRDTLKLALYFNSTLSEDIRTSVSYYQNSQDNLYYPIALRRERNTKDAEVHINASTNWCIGIGEATSGNPKKLSMAMLRSMAHALGYGSSIKQNSRGRVQMFSNNGISKFDQLIFAEDGRRLENQDFRNPSKLKQYAQQANGYLYADQKQPAYKLHAPPTFDPKRSLKYSCDPSSLMYYEELDDRPFAIDPITLELLSTLGWNFTSSQTDAIHIIGEGLPENGIASAYQNHLFRIESGGTPLTNHQWSCSLPLKDGGEEIIASSTQPTFILPAITDENRYARTLEGDIRGVINFSGTTAGNPVSCSYSVTLELKPCILEAKVLSVTPSADEPSYYYDATIEITYMGSHYVHVTVEEEGNPGEVAYFSDVPYRTRMQIKGVDSWADTFIHTLIRNDYGADTYSMRIPATRGGETKEFSLKIEDLLRKEEDCAKVYDASSAYLGKAEKKEDFASFPKGLLLLDVYQKNKKVRTLKYWNR